MRFHFNKQLFKYRIKGVLLFPIRWLRNRLLKFHPEIVSFDVADRIVISKLYTVISWHAKDVDYVSISGIGILNSKGTLLLEWHEVPELITMKARGKKIILLKTKHLKKISIEHRRGIDSTFLSEKLEKQRNLIANIFLKSPVLRTFQNTNIKPFSITLSKSLISTSKLKLKVKYPVLINQTFANITTHEA